MPTALEIAVSSHPLALAVISADGAVLLGNAALEALLQHPLGARLEQEFHPNDRRAFSKMLTELSEFSRAELELRLGNGHWVRLLAAAHHSEAGALEAMVLSFEDISAQRRSRIEQEHQYFFDTLTGLPNRAMLIQQLDLMLESQRRRDQPLSLIFIDLDRFKLVNDTLGFALGDRMLCLVAERLKTVLRPTDLLVRMSGDEFGLLLLGGLEYASNVSRRVLEAFQQPFTLDGHELLSSACLGISVSPLDAVDAAELQAHADLAMFRAKSIGRGRVRFFGNREDHAELEQLELEAQLRHAVEREQMRVYYQPQFELLNGTLIGFEALLRWQHPTLGLLEPARFVPLAEQSGLILGLSHWILHRAAAQVAGWNAARELPLRLSVNLSAAQLERDDLCDSVLAALGESRLGAAQLELEITESQVMAHTPNLERQMRQLHDLGVRFAVDDFGTGYSNLNRLRRIPLNTLKVDRSFVMHLGGAQGNEPSSEPLVRSIVQLAHNLRLDVIAEGVESQLQLEKLHFMGCDYAQGYVFAPPLALAEAEALLRAAPREASSRLL